MARPRRLYINSKGKYYYIVNGVKKFIKVPQGMSQQQIQNINIKNIIAGPARRLKRRTKKIVPVYSKKIAKGEEMEKSVIKTEGGLPAYVFTPQKKFLSIGDLTTKDDTSTDKLINLLKGAIPVIAEGAKKLALPSPEQKFLLGDADKEFINNMIEGKLIESEPAVVELIRRETMPKKPTIPISKSDIQKEKEKLQKQIEETRASREGTPMGTPLPEEGFTMPESFKQKPPEEPPEEPPSVYKETFDVKKAFGIKYLKGFDKEDKKFTKFIESHIVAKGSKKGKPMEPKDWNEETLIDFGKLIGIKLEKGPKKEILQKKIAKKLNQLEPPKKGAGEDNGDDGLYNDQIEKIMKKRIRNFVPVVASDKVNDLLQYVNKGDKFFSAVINTEPSESFGRHWRCIVIDNRDDYPSAEYFDSLAENAKPDDALLSVMRKICKRMNPEKYFKFKYNMLRRQSFNTSNCSYHVMKFIEDRHNGVPFEDASGWSDYMKRQKGNGYEAIDDSQDGEGDLEKYENKIKKQYKSYL
jgi:hypothetical protein